MGNSVTKTYLSCITMQGAAGSPQFCCQRRQLWILCEADWDANLCTFIECSAIFYGAKPRTPMCNEVVILLNVPSIYCQCGLRSSPLARVRISSRIKGRIARVCVCVCACLCVGLGACMCAVWVGGGWVALGEDKRNNDTAKLEPHTTKQNQSPKRAEDSSTY